MKFEVIGFEDKQLWEKITKNGEIYYQWQYMDAFEKNSDGIPKLAYAEKDNKYVYNAFFVRNIEKDLNLETDKANYFDIITPYGYGGIFCTNKDKELLEYFFKEFENYCKNNKIVSEFVRLSPFLSNYSNYDNRYDIKNISKTVYMKLDNSEQIWNDLESRCRNTIRKAQKNNLVIKSGFNKEKMDEFIQIYNETMKRDNADGYYFFKNDFFDSILENLKNFARIYTVYYENKPISSSIILYNGKSAHYHLSGTLSEYMNLGANNLSLYEIALDLCDRGYKSFHLGGGYGGDNSPLLKFKKSFNKFGELDFYIGKKIWNKDQYNRLCKQRGINEVDGFFPAYRK